MTNEQNVDQWVDVITTHNGGKQGTWTARFVIDEVAAVERAVKSVETVNATLGPNGPNHEYAVHVPAQSVREVVSMLAALGARLSPQQTLVSLG